MQMEDRPQGDDLNSWKEIADVIGRTERTARRWEKALGLPVHRVGSGTKKTIHASRTEILEWLRHQGLPAAAITPDTPGPRQTTGALSVSGTVACFSRDHVTFVAVTATIYAALFAISVCLEVAYRFDTFAAFCVRVLPLAFAWSFGTAVFGLRVIWRLSAQSKLAALVAGEGVFLVSAALQWWCMSAVLPATAVVRLGFPAMTPADAHLKNTIYFLIVAAVLWLPPYNFLVTTYHAAQARAAARPLYPRPWSLWLVYGIMLALAVPMGVHLLANVVPGPYAALYEALLWLRTILTFVLALLAIAWYQRWLARFRSDGVLTTAPLA